jgi:hypothetical protein
MSPQPGDESFEPAFGDADLETVFGNASAAGTCAAVLTEARIVLPDISTPLDAELWGSDIVGALGSRIGAAEAFVPAAEQAGTGEALAVLRVIGAIGPPGLRAAASAAAGRLAARLAARGTAEPGWAEPGWAEPGWAACVGAPSLGECWRYGDALSMQEVVTMSFGYDSGEHVVSVLLDISQGGALQDVWIGDAGDVLERTRQMSAADPKMIFEMISQQEARARMDRAFAAGECPRQPEEIGNVASRRAILRARTALLPREPAPPS